MQNYNFIDRSFMESVYDSNIYVLIILDGLIYLWYLHDLCQQIHAKNSNIFVASTLRDPQQHLNNLTNLEPLSEKHPILPLYAHLHP